VTDPTPPLDEWISALPDRVVTRVNELLTTLMDVGGALAVAFGIGWTIWGAPWRHTVAVVVAGILVVLLSNIAQYRAAPKSVTPAETPEPAPLPGASDPGPLHVMGR
jgi:hypothetical protein